MLDSAIEKIGPTQAEPTGYDTHMDPAITGSTSDISWNTDLSHSSIPDLPPGSEILSVTPTGPKKDQGTSTSRNICAAPVKVIVQLPDNGTVELFIKVQRLDETLSAADFLT